MIFLQKKKNNSQFNRFVFRKNDSGVEGYLALDYLLKKSTECLIFIDIFREKLNFGYDLENS